MFATSESFQDQIIKRIFHARPDLLKIFSQIDCSFGGHGQESFFSTRISEEDSVSNDLIWENHEEICRLLNEFSNCQRWDFSVDGAKIVSFPVRDIAQMNKSKSQEVINYNLVPAESPYNHIGKRFYFTLDRAGRYLGVRCPKGEESRLWIPREQMLGKTMEECLPPGLASPRRYYFDTAVKNNEEIVFCHSYESPRGLAAYEVRIIPVGEEVVMICSMLAINTVFPGLPGIPQ